MSWHWSTDGERFDGEGFDTAEDAAGEAFALESSIECVLVGEERDPKEWITAGSIGNDVYERLVEELGEEVGEASDCFELSDDQQLELGKVILAWIDAHGGFSCFGVKNVRTIQRPPNAGAVPRRGSDVGTSHLLGVSE